jgi:competence protein ComFC
MRGVAAWAGAIKGWVDAGLGFIYPEVCQLCGEARATPAESFVCARCREGVRSIQPPFCRRCGLPYQGEITTEFECGNCREADLHFQFARSAVVARGPVLELIRRYKYQRAFWFEPLLAGWLLQAAAAPLKEQGWDCILPIPLHAAKQREREFNQAERLARRLSQVTGIPLGTGLLQRIRPTRSQTLLSRQERWENMDKAFALPQGRTAKDRRIVLVDDVFTTGATTSACAQALRAAGAAEVCVWTVARGI